MKSSFSFFALLILFIFSSYSLDAQIYGGIRGGLNYTGSVQDLPEGLFTDFVSTSPAVGLHFGLYAEIPVAKKIIFQPELLYNLKGFNWDNAGIDLKLSLSYLSLPLLLSVRPFESFSIEIGPELSYLVGATQEQTNATNQDVTSAYADFDLGLATGLTYHFPMGLNFGLRASRGFTTINDFSFIDVEGNRQEWLIRNWNMQLTLGYTFK